MEKSQKIVEAEKTVEACVARGAKIRACREESTRKLQDAEQRLPVLEKGLPRLMAGAALGDITEEEFEKAKAEIAELRETINMVPLLLKGLTKKDAQVFARGEPASSLLQKVDRYREAKAALERKWSPSMERVASGLAELLDLKEDFRAFMETLGRPA